MISKLHRTVLLLAPLQAPSLLPVGICFGAGRPAPA